MMKNLGRRVAAAGFAAAIALTANPITATAAPATVENATVASSEPCVVDYTDSKPGRSFYKNIAWMTCEKLTVGYSDGSFGVNRPITRGEVSSFIYRMSGEKHTAQTNVYKDVKKGATHSNAISWMKTKGITSGYSNGTFGINKPITRGELTAFIVRYSGGADGYTSPKTSQFKDMKPGSAFYRDISWIASTGMINGYADGTFKPKRNVTRGETAKFLYALETHMNGEPTLPVIVQKPQPATPSNAVWTKTSTKLRSGNSWYTSSLATIPAQAQLTLVSSGTKMSKVKYGSKTGWVNTDFISKGKPGGTAKPYANPTTTVQRISNTIAPWCSGVQVKTGTASYSSVKIDKGGYTGDAIDQMPVKEIITYGKSAHGTNMDAVLNQVSSCMTVLQYRAYTYDGAKMDSALSKLGGEAVMAMCMGDIVGPQVYGSKWTSFGCTTTQKAAAQKLLAGKAA